MTDPGAPSAEALMQFLYQAPIGLVQARLDGAITMINPMSVQLLLPLAAGGDLGNLFDVLQPFAPHLRAQAAAAAYPGGLVCDGLRVTVPATAGAPAGGSTLSLQLLRLDADLLMASVSDVTDALRQERQRTAAQVRDATRVDPLTALPNRAAVLERIEHALAQSRLDPQHHFAVLFINGDRFNRVNLTLGPAAGDELLRLMAARIGGAVRQRDATGLAGPDGQTAGRLGVDEFVVVLDGLPGAPAAASAAAAVAQRLVEALARPYVIGGLPVHGSASVGIALGPGAAADAEAVLQDASLAMREAKRGGGGRSSTFEPAMKHRVQHRASLEAELREALEAGQLFVVYQPIVALATGRPVGFEALVRWHHPQRGVVSPLEFIAVAEESGLIAALGAQVLGLACQQFARWQAELAPQAPALLSVNLSRAQLTEPSLLDEVRHALSQSDLPAACLQLEITESLAAESAAIQARLHELKRLGVQLALDDFGTGYSSLSSLHQWPVDVIKIDRSFVSQIDTSAHHRVLAEATVRVARSLGMGTVAEGVETAAQAAVLRELQCEKVQGYHYAAPLTAEQAAPWWRARHASPAPIAAAAATTTPATSAAAPLAALPLEAAGRLFELLHASPLGVALFDPEERLAYANAAFRRAHALTPDAQPSWETMMRAAHQRGTGLLISNPDIEAWLANVRRRYRQLPRREFESDFTDGRWVRVIEDTAPDGWQLCLACDVTHLKVNEAELRRARDLALAASVTDALTGLPNRRHTFDSLHRLLAEAQALRVPLAVAVIDIDFFKQINDRHGHGVGDGALVAFAAGVARTLRPRDLLGRIGGEEFLLVLTNTGRAGAERVLAEARRQLAQVPLSPAVPGLRASFSAGVALAQPGDSGDSLWHRADRGLLAAKAAGRGRDVFVDDGPLFLAPPAGIEPASGA